MAMTMSGEYQLAVAAGGGLGKAQRCGDAEGLHSGLRAARQGVATPNFRRWRRPRSGRSRQGSKAGSRCRDLDPPNGYKISGQGDGGVAGFAKGGARSSWRRRMAARCSAMNVEAQIGGKLAQLGQRLINGAAKKIADEFFQNFAAAVACEDLPDGSPAYRAVPSGSPGTICTLTDRPGRGSD